MIIIAGGGFVETHIGGSAWPCITDQERNFQNYYFLIGAGLCRR